MNNWYVFPQMWRIGTNFSQMWRIGTKNLHAIRIGAKFSHLWKSGIKSSHVKKWIKNSNVWRTGTKFPNKCKIGTKLYDMWRTGTQLSHIAKAKLWRIGIECKMHQDLGVYSISVRNTHVCYMKFDFMCILHNMKDIGTEYVTYWYQFFYVLWDTQRWDI